MIKEIIKRWLGVIDPPDISGHADAKEVQLLRAEMDMFRLKINRIRAELERMSERHKEMRSDLIFQSKMAEVRVGVDALAARAIKQPNYESLPGGRMVRVSQGETMRAAVNPVHSRNKKKRK